MRPTLSVVLVLAIGGAAAAAPQPIEPAVSPKLFSGLHWRSIGPYRGGRVLAVAGVPGDPSTYYFGGVAGGVWKTTNGGLSWVPVFDQQDIASIGAIAVAPSDPNVAYVGSGEACLRGNISYGTGVYRSLDAGRKRVDAQVAAWKALATSDIPALNKKIVASGVALIDPTAPGSVPPAPAGGRAAPEPERDRF